MNATDLREARMILGGDLGFNMKPVTIAFGIWNFVRATSQAAQSEGCHQGCNYNFEAMHNIPLIIRSILLRRLTNPMLINYQNGKVLARRVLQFDHTAQHIRSHSNANCSRRVVLKPR